jgi:hypothetical protein
MLITHFFASHGVHVTDISYSVILIEAKDSQKHIAE